MVIKIGFAKNKKWWSIFGWIIRAVDFKEASHSYLELVTDNGPWIVESVYPRGRILHKDKWLQTYETTHEFSFGTSQSPEDVFRWAELVVKDKEYSLWQNLVIGLTIVFNKTLGKLEFLRINGKQSQNCTEIVAMFIEDWLDTDWTESLDNVSIKELYEFVSKIAWENKDGSISSS
jgi:hypothetical protein